jgi:GH24 family phage-related lysozyme (muramidase)
MYLAGLFELLDTARRESTCIVNTLMTATCWEFARRIVEHEQAGQKCAAHGEVVAAEFSKDFDATISPWFWPGANRGQRSIGLRSVEGGRESGAEGAAERLAERSRSETPPALRRRKHAADAVQKF